MIILTAVFGPYAPECLKGGFSEDRLTSILRTSP
jgi:hypothetical protein